MAYTKTVWVDRNVQFPNRFQKVNENSTSVELIEMPGTILQIGTDIDATKLNKIEDGINNAHIIAEYAQQAIVPSKIFQYKNLGGF